MHFNKYSEGQKTPLKKKEDQRNTVHWERLGQATLNHQQRLTSRVPGADTSINTETRGTTVHSANKTSPEVVGGEVTRPFPEGRGLSLEVCGARPPKQIKRYKRKEGCTDPSW